VIGALILGAFIGLIIAIVGIFARMLTGTATPVTAGGWALGPLNAGGWGLLIGALIGLAEVLSGKKLADTWGVKIALSSVGSMAGGLLGWWAWTKLSVPSTPADGKMTVGEVKS
jgi:hypothetical protein